MLFAGCSGTSIKWEYSEILYEEAIVVSKLHEPSQHETNVTFRLFRGENVASIGVGMDGKLGIGIGNGIMATSSDIHEKWGVLFKCKHGTFESNGIKAKHRTLYENLSDGQSVKVYYKEVYRAIYDKGELRERRLMEMNFIDATPIQ